MENEHVLVVPTEVFRRVGYFQGFCHDADPYLRALLRPEWMSYRPRREVESDPSFKQLIPYVIFRHIDADDDLRLFCYTRGSGQGEKRLHAKRSIGIGGHISVEDSQQVRHDSVYLEGMRRELEEEVVIESEYRSRCVGLINDDETEVGRVHLGIVHLFDMVRPAVAAREDDITEARFAPVAELIRERDGFESWSQICLEALFM